MTSESVKPCDSVSLQFLTENGRALRRAHVAIEAGARKTFVTNDLGMVHYPEATFSESGSVFLEHETGDKHLSWAGKIPTEKGHYKIYLDVWTNHVDGSQ